MVKYRFFFHLEISVFHGHLCNKSFFFNFQTSLSLIFESCRCRDRMVLFCLWCLTPLSAIFQLYRGGSLVEEIGIPGENHRPVASHWQTLSQNVIAR
jgi:hypothetical protein